jgi:hypothetical protein
MYVFNPLIYVYIKCDGRLILIESFQLINNTFSFMLFSSKNIIKMMIGLIKFSISFMC